MKQTDVIVIGGGVSGLVAAISIAKAGKRVVLFEAQAAWGGGQRELEIVPGFRAAPLAEGGDWLPGAVSRALGIKSSAPTRVPVRAAAGPGAWVELGDTPAVTAEKLRRYSAKDAANWPVFADKIRRWSGVLERLYRMPAPRIDADSIGDVMGLLQAGRLLRGLGKKEMVELLRVLPMAVAELLDEWFETDALKGAIAGQAVTDLGQGPMSGATSFALVHRSIGNGTAVGSNGGVTNLTAELVAAAKGARVELHLDARVQRLTANEDRITGVELASGERWDSSVVISSAGPYQTLLELLDPVYLYPEFIQAVRNIRFRGVTTKVLVALEGLPSVPEQGRAAIRIAPSIRYLEKGYDASKYGRYSAAPFVELVFPSVHHPGLAPPGGQVGVLHVQYTPYRLRDGDWDGQRDAIADIAIRTVDEQVPGFTSRIVGRRVLTPVDIEREFGYREGAVSQGEMMLDQILFMRPVAGWARYRTPIEGLYLTGAGTHPGPGGESVSGWLTARAASKAGEPAGRAT